MLTDIIKALRRAVPIALVSLLTGACATSREALPQIAAWTAAGGAPPPRQRECPYVAQVDLQEIARDARDPAIARQREDSRARIQAMLDEIAISQSSPHRPGPDADIVLRSVLPPGGLYSNTIWSVVWRNGAGEWLYWRQNRDPAMMPPPPPPPLDPAEYPAYLERYRGWWPSDDERWPPETGRLNPAQAAALDAALEDPCRAWEPDIWPWDPPLHGLGHRPAPPLPHDWTPVYVELREDERVRQIGGAGHHGSLQGVLVSIASYPRP